MQLEAVRRDVSSRGSLFQGIELRARVHLEDSVALLDSPPYLACEYLGGVHCPLNASSRRGQVVL
jgi:hypothetical protein